MADERRNSGNPYGTAGGRQSTGSGQSRSSAGRTAGGSQSRSSAGRPAGSSQSRGSAGRPAGSSQSRSSAARPAGSSRNRSDAGRTADRRKRLTRAQRRRRYNIRRYSILAALALIVIGIIVLIALLLSALIRHIGGSDTAAAAAASTASVTETISGSETAAVSASPSPTPEPAQTVTIMAVGDNLIHNTVYEYAQQDDGSYDFTDIYRYVQDDIESADLACIQQETIFISDPDQYSNYPCFGTPTEMADSLTAVGFDVVCHASNHTLDKGTTGIMDTLEKWKEHPEVTVLGIHDTEEDYNTIRVVEKNGIKIALLDYTYGLNGFVPEEDYYVDLLDEDHKAHIQAQVEEAVSISDIVVVFMHDGTEDQLTPDDDQLSWAQFFADEGVGLIIGTHPHVIEPTDVLTGVNGNKMPVFYSLGNFVSSQADTINMVGAIANATITKDASGTYVSDYSVEPVCTLISNEGKYGNGYAFHVYHLEDYTDELAAKHIRDACTPEDFWSVWDSVFDGDPAWNGTGSTASAAEAADGTTDTAGTTEMTGTTAATGTTDTTTTDTAAAVTTGETAAAVTPIAGTAAAAATAVRHTVLAKAA